MECLRESVLLDGLFHCFLKFHTQAALSANRKRDSGSLAQALSPSQRSIHTLSSTQAKKRDSGGPAVSQIDHLSFHRCNITCTNAVLGTLSQAYYFAQNLQSIDFTRISSFSPSITLFFYRVYTNERRRIIYFC